MPDPACFIEPFGYCVTNANAVSGAFLTAIASLLTTAWKIFSDRELATKRQDFEASERQSRQNFETSEREARSQHETQQKEAAAHAHQAMQKNLQTYIQLEKWREEAWQRALVRIDQASQQLEKTTAGLTGLIDDGPHYPDLQMIKETAKVLDVFGDFQTSVRHYSLPDPMAKSSSELVDHVTKILLTLSPSQSVRQSTERRELLIPLRAELIRLTSQFMRLCRDFERNPSAFIEHPNAA